MKKLSEFLNWIVWLFLPLIIGVRWFFFLLFILCIFYGVRADFIKIPEKEELLLVNGEFLMPPGMDRNRRSQYAIRVADAGGVIHKCNCSFGGFSSINCLSENYSLNDKYIKQLKNQQVSLLLSQSSGVGTELCYELRDSERTWFFYEEMSGKYERAKSGWVVKFSWILLVMIVGFVLVRAIFHGKNNNG